MTSLLNQSGLNFQNGNPLGRKVRSLEADVDTLKKEIQALKAGGATSNAGAAATVSPSFIAEMDALKRDMAMIKLAGFGKGEKGDRGEKGDKGDKGDTGPMTYIAMPAAAAAATMPAAPAAAAVAVA